MDPEDLPVTIRLTNTAAALAGGRSKKVIREILLDELNENAYDLIDGLFLVGGFTDENVTIATCTIADGGLTATVYIDFTELMPSGCADMPFPEDRRVQRRIVLEPSEEHATVEPDLGDPEEWDMSDRNSAADGT